MYRPGRQCQSICYRKCVGTTASTASTASTAPHSQSFSKSFLNIFRRIIKFDLEFNKHNRLYCLRFLVRK